MKLNEMMKQAQAMQSNLAAAQESVKQLEVQGESGAGLVKVRMSGAMEVLRVEIDPAVLSEDKEVLEDLLAAAVNDGVRRAQAAAQEKMTEVAAGMGLPAGFKMPF
ncbi:MAG: YbaB/EbfC family nucleoid-associated protein [Halieaceae bacterium]|jgi:DNA-binding YbaB/EbfC family protein|nr:YbaB/EbfC family nucleoid-associated protein [Halieaceae bacterium]